MREPGHGARSNECKMKRDAYQIYEIQRALLFSVVTLYNTYSIDKPIGQKGFSKGAGKCQWMD
jgi:hypothetical protein